MEAQCSLGIGAEKQREITLHGFYHLHFNGRDSVEEMSPCCNFSPNVVLTSKKNKNKKTTSLLSFRVANFVGPQKTKDYL